MHPPRHRRRRFWFLQFSLRTLLAATTLAAVACAWYLQPPSREELLAGGQLKLWRQVKLVDLALPTGLRSVPPNTPPPEPILVNHGRWVLSDASGGVISRGYYRNGEMAGPWVTYYPNGKRAVAGEMWREVRVGLWQTWDATGRLQTETTYELPPPELLNLSSDDFPFLESSIRSGPAKAWDSDGSLLFSGNFAEDREEGPWEHYHADGSLRSQGAYRAGKRQGAWTFFDSSGKQRVELYTDGRTQAELNHLLARLAAQLERNPFEGHTATIAELEALGAPAVPVIAQALESRDTSLISLAACALGRLGSSARPALPRLRELAESQKSHEQLCAQVAIYAIEPSGRAAAFEPLLVRALDQETPAALELLAMMFRADPLRRVEIIDQLLVFRLADETLVVVGIAELGNEVLPYLERHVANVSPRVRRRIAEIISIRRGSPSFSPQDSLVWVRTAPLVARLKADPDDSVRAAAESADWQFTGATCFGSCF